MYIDDRCVCARCLRPNPDDGVCPACGFDEYAYESAPHVLPMEAVVQDRYMIGSVLGEGGFGITYAAWDMTMDRPVCVKEFFPQNKAERNADATYIVQPQPDRESRLIYARGMKWYLREARILSMCAELEGIVHVSDCLEANGTAYLVMDFIRGRSLADEAKAQGGKMDPERLLALLRAPIEALGAVHRVGESMAFGGVGRIIHRDISPDNLMIEEGGGVRLIDFGAAVDLGEESTNNTQAVFRKKGYTPPEQLLSADDQGPWTDVYALCATIYTLLAGEKLPEDAASKRGAAEAAVAKLNVSRRIKRALTSGLEIDYKKRTQNIPMLLHDLYGDPLPEEIRLRRRLRQVAIGCAAAFVAAAALIAVNFSYGFPLAQGMRFSLHADGLHLIYADTQVGEIPASCLYIPVSAVEGGAFSGNTAAQLTVPGSVRRIEERAFYGCMALESVTMEEGVTRVDAMAFAQCPMLHTANVPKSLAHMDAAAFQETSPDLVLWGARGSDAQALAAQAGLPFADRAEYTVVPNETGLTLQAYDGPEGECIFPAFVDNTPVTAFSREVNALRRRSWSW